MTAARRPFGHIRKAAGRLRALIALRPTWASFFENAGRIVLNRSSARVVLRNGLKLHAPPNHPLLEMSFELLFKNSYTPRGLEIGKGETIIDIGANVGVFALRAAMETGNRVYAYEPFPLNFEFLQKNIRANSAANIVATEAAVGKEAAFGHLSACRNPAGCSLLTPRAAGDPGLTVEVPTVTLPALMDAWKLTRVDFLKMDCEGSEGDIFAATPKPCLRRVRRIALEFHDNVSVLGHDDLVSFLKTSGFSTRLSWDGRGPFGFIYAWR